MSKHNTHRYEPGCPVRVNSVGFIYNCDKGCFGVGYSMKLTIDTSHRLPESRIKHKCYLPLVRKGKRCEIEKPRRRIK